MECRSGSLRLDAGRPNHLGPFFCFVADEFLEFEGRHRHRHRGQIGKTRSEFWIGESGSGLFIKSIDDLGGRAFRGADAIPAGGFISWHEFRQGRDIR
jgi:hypothetical protein